MLDFRFTSAHTDRTLDAFAERIRQPRLWIPKGNYPGHSEWADKAIADWQADRKGAIIAFWGSEAVGMVVYQRGHDSTELEIKNISIEPAARGRHVADFLLRQAEEEGQVEYPGVQFAVADAKASNNAIIAFALQQGYRVIDESIITSNFGHNGQPDVKLRKPLVASLDTNFRL